MPIPKPTFEQSLATVQRFETLLVTAVAEQQGPKEVYWAAEDLAFMAESASYPEARYRAGHALIRALETTERPKDRDAIQQAIAWREYKHPKARRKASAKTRATSSAAAAAEQTPPALLN